MRGIFILIVCPGLSRTLIYQNKTVKLKYPVRVQFEQANCIGWINRTYKVD